MSSAKKTEKKSSTSSAKESSASSRDDRKRVSPHSPSFFFPDFSILTRYLICADESAATNTETEEALEGLCRRIDDCMIATVRFPLFLSLPRLFLFPLLSSPRPIPLAFISLSRLTRCPAFRSHDCSRQRANCVDDP